MKEERKTNGDKGDGVVPNGNEVVAYGVCSLPEGTLSNGTDRESRVAPRLGFYNNAICVGNKDAGNSDLVLNIRNKSIH